MENRKKNKGGRPKKSAEESRSKAVSVYLTPGEYEELERMQGPFRTSKSEIIGRLLRGYRGEIHQPMTDEHKEFASDLARIGANINQCALRLNEITRSVVSQSDPNLPESVLILLQHYSDRANKDAQEVLPLIRELRDVLLQRTPKK